MTTAPQSFQQTIHEALAQKLDSIGIWEGFLHAPLITGAERDLMVAALRGDAIAELEIALTMCRDTNRVLSEELKFIRARTIEACARVCDDVVTRAERLMEDPKAARGTLADVIIGAMECAENIRAISQAPVTDAVPSVNLNWLVDWVHLYATEGHSWISRGTTDKLVRLAVRAPTQADADYLKTGMLSDLPEVSHD